MAGQSRNQRLLPGAYCGALTMVGLAKADVRRPTRASCPELKSFPGNETGPGVTAPDPKCLSALTNDRKNADMRVPNGHDMLTSRPASIKIGSVR